MTNHSYTILMAPVFSRSFCCLCLFLKVSPFSHRGSYRMLWFLCLASFTNCALGFELVALVTNFAKDTISVVLHSLLVDIPIGAVQEQETVANETEIPSDAGTCRLYVHKGRGTVYKGKGF